MASTNLFFLITLPLLNALAFFPDPSCATTDMAPAAATPVSPGSICKSTPDPEYCKSVIPKHTTDVYTSGRFSIGKALSQSRKFLYLVDKYLKRQSTLSITAIRALSDCRLLAASSMDFLLSSFETVNNKTSTTLPSMQADDVQTFLSAIITNQQTCLDGLQATASAYWSVKNGLSLPLSNDTKLYSVSLALFTKAWVLPKRKKRAAWKPRRRKHLHQFRNGRLPLKMSGKTLAIYESVRRRKLLQTTAAAADGGGGGDDDAVTVVDIVTVSKDGSGNFTTITDAVNAAPNNTNVANNGYFLVYITAGVYQEYVSIAKNKKNLMIIGDGINQTIITGNRSVVDGFTTFNSATFAVVAPNFVAVNITIRNTAGAIKQQAVALRNGADLSTFYSCSFEGYQDTLYTHSLRQFFRECDIYGTIDFIFGNAAVVLQNCNIFARLPLNGQFNTVTAQGRTDPNQNTGTSIQNCTITAAADLASSNRTVQTYLGRPWKEYSRTVVMQSFMDGFMINQAGWQVWNGSFALSTLYYAECNNTGAGSNTTNRVAWPGYHVINATVAANFTVSEFLLGDEWIPQTGVPYTAEIDPTTPVPPETICMFTPKPSDCISVLPAIPNPTADTYTYGQLSILRALSKTSEFLNLIDTHLKLGSSTLSISAIRALEDCSVLAGINMEYLSSSFQTVNGTRKILPVIQADDVQTRLSAILTNHQTCLDGIQTSDSSDSMKNDLSGAVSDNTKLGSVLLALFKKGWVGERKMQTSWQQPRRTQQHLFGKDGQLPQITSDRVRKIYNSVRGRKLTVDGVIVTNITTVAQDGTGNFSTITDAVNAAPNNTNVSNGYFLIYITAGIYREYVSIPRNKLNLMMIGDGINQTIITGNRSVADGFTTFNCGTFIVVAPNFVAAYMTFQNTAGPSKNQAVAVRSDADLSAFYSCSFEAYQDTLYTHTLRQFYRECDIYGTVDFIFGNAAVVLQNCNIYPRLPLTGQFNTVTAQGRTDPNQNTGTSIQNCSVTAAGDLASTSNQTVQTYLGRPWKEYSRTIFMESFMDGLINPAGWSVWSGDFALSTLYYAEFNNTGAGSNTSNRVTWPGYQVINNATVAVNFTVSNFLIGDNWLPQTAVPYTGGF